MRVTRNDAAAIPEIFTKAPLEMQLLNAPNALRRTRDAGTVQQGNRRTKDAVASGKSYGLESRNAIFSIALLESLAPFQVQNDTIACHQGPNPFSKRGAHTECQIELCSWVSRYHGSTTDGSFVGLTLANCIIPNVAP